MPIFDQGYQHWSGELAGHSWRWLAIAQHGVRIGMKSSIMRLMLIFAWLPAIGLVLALCIWGLVEQRSSLVQALLSFLSFLGPEILSDPKSYRVEIWTLCYEYFLLTEMRLSMVLILIAGPSLISQDIRFNALPLYFSRPLRRIDYFLGKLGVIGAFLGMVLVAPSIVAYVLGLLFSLDSSIVADTFPLLLASVAYGRLGGLRRSDAREAAKRTLDAVGMTKHKDRVVRGYSKGMRQRTKLAQALVHDPQVLFLDEPLTGTDPVARRDLMDTIARLGSEGKSVLVSSHVLHEVQSLTSTIILLNRGRLVAEGQVRQIRDLIDKHPHQIVLICDDYRKLAGRVLAWDDVEGVRILRGDQGVMVETRSPDAFYNRLPELSLEDGMAIREVYSDDDNLEAVFKYLVNK